MNANTSVCARAISVYWRWIGSERRTNKLRRGVYVLAIRTSDSQRTPHWPSIRFVAQDGSSPVLAQASVIGYEAVPFDYIALTVDAA